MLPPNAPASAGLRASASGAETQHSRLLCDLIVSYAQPDSWKTIAVESPIIGIHSPLTSPLPAAHRSGHVAQS